MPGPGIGPRPGGWETLVYRTNSRLKQTVNCTSIPLWESELLVWSNKSGPLYKKRVYNFKKQYLHARGMRFVFCPFPFVFIFMFKRSKKTVNGLKCSFDMGVILQFVPRLTEWVDLLSSEIWSNSSVSRQNCFVMTGTKLSAYLCNMFWCLDYFVVYLWGYLWGRLVVIKIVVRRKMLGWRS
jgi:hypothetical protein